MTSKGLGEMFVGEFADMWGEKLCQWRDEQGCRNMGTVGTRFLDKLVIVFYKID
jgi:hypothetical protein